MMILLGLDLRTLVVFVRAMIAGELETYNVEIK